MLHTLASRKVFSISRERHYSLSGEPVPGLCYPQSEELFLHIQMEFPVFQFVLIVPYPVAGHH